MKKIYFAALAVALMSLASCGSKQEEPVEAESIPVEDVQLNPTETLDAAFAALDTADDAAIEDNIEAINAQIETLAENGEEESAATYLARLQEWYETNKEKVKDSEVVKRLVSKTEELAEKYDLEELKEKAKEKYQEFKDEHGDEIKEKASEAKEKAKEKYQEFKDEHGDEIKEKASEAKEKAKEKYQDFKDKHGDEIREKASDAKAKAKEQFGKLLNK